MPNCNMPSFSDMANLKEFSDMEITCRDCNRKFIWTTGEQEYYKQYNLFKPSRCIDCRKKRKMQNNNFNKRTYGYDKPYLRK